MDDPLRRLRDRLLTGKRDEPDRGKRIEIAEALADLDEIERTAPATAVNEWCRVHAPNWEATPGQRKILKTFLELGPAGATREEIAAILGDDDHGRSSASIGKVRSAITRLRQAWAESGSTATIPDAGHDGVYHTHDPVIQTLDEVSQKRHR